MFLNQCHIDDEALTLRKWPWVHKVMRLQFIGHHCANIDPLITKLVIWLWEMPSMKIATSPFPPPKKNKKTFIVWSSNLSGPMFTSGSSKYISFLLSSVKNLFLKGSFLGPIFFSHPSRIKSLVSSSANWKIKILFLNPIFDLFWPHHFTNYLIKRR